jgi:hypothetical protein
MKQFVMIGIALLFVTFSSGCASMYNHSRVKENIYKEAIVAHGTEEQKELLKQGVKPTRIIKFSALQRNGEVDGVGVGINAPMDGFNVFGAVKDGVGSYFSTYAEAPLSSTGALVLDIVAGILAYQLIEDELDNNTTVRIPSEEEDVPTGAGSNTSGGDTIVITGDGNTVNNGSDGLGPDYGYGSD